VHSRKAPRVAATRRFKDREHKEQNMKPRYSPLMYAAQAARVTTPRTKTYISPTIIVSTLLSMVFYLRQICWLSDILSAAAILAVALSMNVLVLYLTSRYTPNVDARVAISTAVGIHTATIISLLAFPSSNLVFYLLHLLGLSTTGPGTATLLHQQKVKDLTLPYMDLARSTRGQGRP